MNDIPPFDKPPRPDNLRFWAELSATDPKRTKRFTIPGGFQGTSINPTWQYLRMTDCFGPIGSGWGFEQPQFEIIPTQAGLPEPILLARCTLECWYIDHDQSRKVFWGIGCDRLVKNDSRGTWADEDVWKKLVTDALTNGLSRLGIGSDIRLGLFDDVKYLASVRAHFDRPNLVSLPTTTESSPPDSQTNPTQPILKPSKQS